MTPAGPGAASDAEIAEWFQEFARSRSRRLRNRLVEAHLGFGIHVARRYANRGVAEDDLRQVAMLALVKAVDRFDPSRGVAFSTFAGRTIEGEIKRHFRDASWSVRVPRSAKELHLAVRRATDDLTQRLGRSPTPREVAEELGVSLDDVVTAMTASAAHSPESIDTSASGDDAPTDRQGILGTRDPNFGHLEDRVLVDDLIASLPERERKIVTWRFYENLTQSEIAERLGLSQMHISRLLRKSFEMMREELATRDGPGSELGASGP